MIRNTPDWRIAEEIELDFKKFEIRIVKIFLDGLYGCGMEDADMEDLVKLVALVDEYLDTLSLQEDMDQIRKGI